MAQNVKAGDRILVTVEAVVRSVTDKYIIIGDSHDDRKKIYMGVNTAAAETLKILSRELKVGDEVYAVAINGNRYTNNAIIAAIAEGQALLKWTGSGGFGNYPLSKLKLDEEGCDC